jgi:hypothetical protein
MSKNKKTSKIKQIFEKIGIDDTYTKKAKYKFDTVKANTFPKHGFNAMADLLMLPKTDSGYQYCLTMIDIWSNFFDFEPMKTKTAKETLQAMLNIFKRNYIDKPKASLKTDSGGEFQGVFDKWLRDHKIAHLQSLPGRHKQTANVENLNRQLGRIFMSFLTDKSIALGYEYTNWTDIEKDVRIELNKIKTHPKDEDPYTYPMSTPNVQSPPKYKVGDLVYRPLEKPEGISGNKEFGRFRVGDRRFDLVPHKIKQVFLYQNNFRYMLNGFENVAFAEAELLPAKEAEEMYVVEAIRDEKKEKNKIYYLIKWKGYKVSENTWEPKAELLTDLGKERLDQLIDDYKESLKPKKKVTKK